MKRFPSKTNVLQFLKSSGVTFGSIIDVGTHAETRELRIAFPELRHVLFEPAPEFFEKIEANYAGMNWVLAPVAVSDTDGTGILQKISVDGGEVTHSKLLAYASQVVGTEAQRLGIVSIPTTRLDTYFKENREPAPFLLKIDVDGFEMPILRGAEGIWDQIDCVIVEATHTTILDRMTYICQKNFHLMDIIDQCYYGGMFSQVDLVFVSERLRQSNAALRPWETLEFSWDKWIPVANYERFLPPDTDL